MPINVDKIDAQAINDYLEQYGGRYGLPCQPGCMMKCSNYFVNRQGQHTASAYNYETLGLAGSNLLLDDLAVMSEIKRLCDEYGVDSIEMGNALALIMEAGLVEWGDGQGIIARLHKILDEGLFAEELAQGNNALGAALGVVRVPTVRGQTLAAYDIRVSKGLGFGSIVGPMGGDHTVGGSGPNEDGKYQDPTLFGLARTAAVDSMLCAFLSQPMMMDKEILAVFFSCLRPFLADHGICRYCWNMAGRLSGWKLGSTIYLGLWQQKFLLCLPTSLLRSPKGVLIFRKMRLSIQ